MNLRTDQTAGPAPEVASEEEILGHRIVQVLALAVVGMGLVVGASWWLGSWQALAFGSDRVPMAPSTALLLVVLGSSLFASSRWRSAPVARGITMGCLFFVVISSLLLGGQSIGNLYSLEHWIVGDLATSTGIPAGLMSPLTALAFLLASVALLCQRPAVSRRPACLFASVALSWSIFLISEVTLTGYASGLPPVLGDSNIPPAMLTALALMLTSIAILLPSLTQVRLFQRPSGAEGAEALGWVIAVAVSCVVVAAALRAAIVGESGGDMLPYVTFYPAVLIVALYTGLAGGLLATLLAGIYVQGWLHGGLLTATEWLALSVFLIGCTITSLICEAMRQSRGRERQARIALKLEVAEHARAADALRRSEQKFRSVFEQAGGYCMILDPNTADGIPIIRDANSAAWVTHGYEREELHHRIQKLAAQVPGVVFQYQQWPDGRSAFPYASERFRELFGVEAAEVATDATAFFDRIHPDDRSRVEAKIAQSMRDLTTWHGSARVQLPSGRMIWVEVDASPEPQADGSVLWHGHVRDVTDRRRAEEERRRFQDMLARTEHLAEIGSWEWDMAADEVTWSDELFRLFQIDPARGAPSFAEHDQLFAGEDFERLQAAVGAAISQGTPYVLELLARRRDGTKRVVLARGYPETGANDQVTRLYGSVQDITRRKETEHRLQLAASVFAHSSEGILITDAENRIIDANPAFSAITGFDRAGVLGKNPSILASGRHDDAFYRVMWHSIARTGVWQGEVWNRRKGGEIYAELLSISTVLDAERSVRNYIGVFSDISKLKAHEADLYRLANYDALTGLPNRRLLGDRLEQAISETRRSGRRMAVCYLDLDAFKPINDEYGHEAGDELLIGIANRLRKVLRAQDTVARLGGDEFVLVFSDLVQLEDALVLLERLRAAATSPISVQGVSRRISASIGVTLSPPDVPSADILLRHADQAMYRAKDAGRNRYQFFDAEQDVQVHDRRAKLQRIDEALTGREFVLYYQPKVDMASREVIGVEALIRWRHPDEGLLLPGAFLSAVEGGDLEIAIGEWVITAALTQVLAWKRTGLDLPISINIGARHLLQPNFSQRLEQLLAEHPACDPGCLEVEILETSALADLERAAQTLTACRALGVRVALDDFGTGYSSLTYFRRLPIDVLKIDQSFVRDMLDDPDDLEIVESVVRLARAFDRSVIAEGVETPEHGALLSLVGCRFGQGFGIARPMPADAIPAWVSTWPEQGHQMVVEPGIGKDDIPLMMAMGNHRRWVDDFIDALNDADISRLAEIDSQPCRFERWYQGSGASRYGGSEEFQLIGDSHASVHALARSIVAFAEQGETEDARGRLPSLLAARDELIGRLGTLIRTLSNRSLTSETTR